MGISSLWDRSLRTRHERQTQSRVNLLYHTEHSTPVHIPSPIGVVREHKPGSLQGQRCAECRGATWTLKKKRQKHQINGNKCKTKQKVTHLCSPRRMQHVSGKRDNLWRCRRGPALMASLERSWPTTQRPLGAGTGSVGMRKR